MHPISIAAEKIFTLFGFLPVTNSLLTTWLVMALLITLGYLAGRKVKKVPSGLQNLFEMLFEWLLGMIEMFTGDKKKAREFFVYAVTIFIFILFSNWMGLIPGVGSIGFFEEEVGIGEIAAESAVEGAVATKAIDGVAEAAAAEHETEFVPLFRAGSSDLSFTLALALATILYVQYCGIKHLRLGYFKKFINFTGPIQFFVGLLEIVSEFAKIVSFSFRLFGNIFAGEVLLVVMLFLAPYIVPIPFYGLEVFVGLVQSLVFMALTLVFLSSATSSHH
ncbi:MAG: F0F1 ATP synthase subunit A [Patescibacteria group bacterium]